MGLELYNSKLENQLIRACIEKDGRAQRAMYEKYAPHMYALCLRYVKEASDAEDVLITGFMKVFDKMHTYSGQGSLGGWIRRIMINESLGYLRRNKTMYLEVEVEAADRDPNWQLVNDHLQTEDLLNMVSELPMGYRTVFNLYAIEGYSHKEISKMLGISESTSKSQLSRARGLLQQKLLESEQEIKRKITKS
ncbi:MAG: RNA polymerase sigma factor [Cyclobacteriaceae bacterium]|nr:RNA polymerase sigma factor [Cyclobacteriaceae bacterium]